MEDQVILDKYFDRNEDAITLSLERYGNYCVTIAGTILSREDAWECVNDAMLRAWNTIPPARPEKLRLYLGRITRNLVLDRWRANHRKYRAVEVPLEELKECIPSGQPPETQVLARELSERIDVFLRQCPKLDRQLFIRRYYHLQSVEKIAGECGITANNAAVRLHRTRMKLKAWLEQEGYL